MKITIRQPLSFSEVGRKDNQEDSLYPPTATAATRTFVLCDGMGGHDHGEVASATVCEALGSWFEQHPSALADKASFNEALAAAYAALDAADTGTTGKKMGTTMTCLHIHDGGCLVAHIGDSRIYHVRPASYDKETNCLGILYQSSDHSLVNDLLRAGELTEEEARDYPHKNIITRAMQPHLETPCRADIFNLTDVQGGDWFFLCCDGVLEQLTNERLCEVLADDTLSDAAKRDKLKEECDGRTRDNYTCWLIPIDSVEQESSDAPVAGDDTLLADVVEVAPEEKPAEESMDVSATATAHAPASPNEPMAEEAPSAPLQPERKAREDEERLKARVDEKSKKKMKSIALWSLLATVAVAVTLVLALREPTSQQQSSNGVGDLKGHAYVDLGLPSGLLWATCNIGASSPEEYGDYFAWGEKEPKSDYSLDTYKYCNDTEGYSFSKYVTDSEYGDYGKIDNKTALESSDDAATANWGGSWRMPTRAEWVELNNTDNCTWTWTTQDGHDGYKVTSVKNGNSIFLPAAGYRVGSSLLNAGSNGYYWSSSLFESDPSGAWRCYFDSSHRYANGISDCRHDGQSVRPVSAP